MSSIAAIAFDLDGTLVDSAPDIAFALNTGLRAAGLPAFDLDRVRPWIGDGPDALIEHALAAHGKLNAPSQLRSRLRAAFDATTLASPLSHGIVYDGIDAMLHQLAREMPLVVVTNKPTPLARAVLGAARLLPYLADVLGADTRELRKPSPLMLQIAANRLALRPEQLLMVGDGPADVGAARAAGCPAAVVGWGYGHAAIEDDAGAWRVSTPQHLLGRLLPRRSAVATCGH